MSSSKFKQELKQEAEQWRIEGLITPNIYNVLAQRYQFTNLTNNANNRFTAIIITFGCILLGLAMITFVAANWQMWSKTIKVAILVSSFLLTNISGFYLWQSANTNWQSRFGQGLLLVGSLIFGANLGLMSQMFHQTGELYELYFIWGFAVLLMAYGLSLTSLGIVAIILVCLGYFSSFNWFFGSNLNYLIQLIPLLVSLLFIPLAYRCRSPWIFFLTSCLIIVSFNINCLRNVESIAAPFRGCLFAIALMLPLAFFWSYQDKPKLFAINTTALNNHSFTNLSRKTSILYLSIVLYIASFNWWWQSSFNKTNDVVNLGYYLSLSIEILLFAVIAVYWWRKLGKRNNSNASWRLDKHSVYVGVVIIISSILFALNFNYGLSGYLGTTTFNTLLFLLALILIRHALKSEQRLGYWSGVCLLSLQIFSRMFEYNTGLLTKAIVLFICGLGVIIAGIWFERNLAQS